MSEKKYTERFKYPSVEHDIDYDTANRMIEHYDNAKSGEKVNFVGVNRETAVYVCKALHNPWVFLDFDYVEIRK